MFWIYKCNSRRHAHQVAFGDWSEFFRSKKARQWGSTEWVLGLTSAHPGDVVIAYQTDRNELAGVASVVRWKARGKFQDLILKPIQPASPPVKVRPLKRSDPRVAAIPALQPGPIRTLYDVTPADARRLLKAAGITVPQDAAPESTPRSDALGGGFGWWEDNRVVEKAAVDHVTEHYESRGWEVHDRNRENLGYDLVCEKSGREIHVEVKGVSGSVVQFPITNRERRTWSSDSAFVLAVVTEALTLNPRLRTFRGARGQSRFEFREGGFVARLAKKTNLL